MYKYIKKYTHINTYITIIYTYNMYIYINMCISHDTALNSHSIVGRPPVLHLLRQHRWTAVAFLRPKAKVRTGKSWEWYGFTGLPSGMEHHLVWNLGPTYG